MCVLIHVSRVPRAVFVRLSYDVSEHLTSLGYLDVKHIRRGSGAPRHAAPGLIKTGGATRRDVEHALGRDEETSDTTGFGGSARPSSSSRTYGGKLARRAVRHILLNKNTTTRYATNVRRASDARLHHALRVLGAENFASAADRAVWRNEWSQILFVRST